MKNLILSLFLGLFWFSSTLAQDVSFKRRDIRKLFLADSIQNIEVFAQQNHYHALNFDEQMMLALIKREYTSFFEVFEKSGPLISFSNADVGTKDHEVFSDMLFEYGYYNAYKSHKDSLNVNISERFSIEKSQIRLDLPSSGLERSQQRFIEIMIAHLEFVQANSQDQRKLLDLHFDTQSYLESYPQGENNAVLDKLHGKYKEPGWLGLEANWDLIFIQRTKGIADYLSRNFATAVDLRVYANSTFFGVRFNLNHHPIQFNLSSSGGELLAGDTLRGLSYQFLLGRQFTLNKYLFVSPFLAYTFAQFSYTEFTADGPVATRTKTQAFAAGFDFYVPLNRREMTQTMLTKRPRFLRTNAYYFKFGFTYNQPRFEQISPQLNGTYNFVHFGLGAFFRNTRAVVVDRNRIVN